MTKKRKPIVLTGAIPTVKDVARTLGVPPKRVRELKRILDRATKDRKKSAR